MNEPMQKLPSPDISDSKHETTGGLAAYQGVWVFVEHELGPTQTLSWELLGEGRKLAYRLGVELAAVICGEHRNLEWEYPRGGYGILCKFG